MKSSAKPPRVPSRSLPIVAKVDVAVCGGTVAAVAAATAAARAGASVFLGCAGTFLGEDACDTGECLSLAVAPTAGSPLLKRLFPKKADLPPGGPVAPARLQRALDEALLDAGVAFRFLSHPEQLLADRAGRVAGVVFATKSGRYAVQARHVLDATANGVVAAAELPSVWPESTRLRVAAVRAGGDGPAIPAPADERDTAPGHLATAEADVDIRSGSDGGDLAAIAAIEAADRRLRAGLWTRDAFWVGGRCALSRTRRVAPGASKPGFGVVGPAAPDGGKAGDDGFAGRIRRGEAAGARAAAEALAAPAADGVPRPAPGRALGARERAVFGVPCTDPRALRDAVGWTDGIPAPPLLDAAGTDGAPPLPALTVDVLVVGGGTAGAPAAIAAARAGAKVLCIEPLGMLGGTATAGSIANYWHGYREGFTAECIEAMRSLTDGWTDGTFSNPMWKSGWLRDELEKAGGEVWFGATATGAIVEPGSRRVRGAVVHTRWGCRAVVASLVVDATGNADVAALAGAPTREAWQDGFAFQGCGTHTRPFRPAYRNADWTFVLDSDIADQTRAFVAARRKADGRAFDMNPLVGTRERRQIVGDVTLTPVDVFLETFRPDTVARCHSNFDTHGMTVFPLFHVLPPDRRPLDAWLPMGALVPKGWTGLAATGLAVSAQRDAMPVLRMMPEAQNQAYAVGLAAAWLAADAGRGGAPDFRRADFERLRRVLVDYRRCLPEKALLDPPGGPDAFDGALARVLAGPLSTHSEVALAYARRTETVRALARSVHDTAEDDAVRLRRALLLAVLGSAAGEPELLAALRGADGWDAGWNYRGMGQFGRSMSPLDDVVACLGRIRSAAAAPAVLRLAGAIGPDTELSHVRAVALYAENLAADAALRPRLARALSRALASVGPLHAWPALRDELDADDGDWAGTATRNASLKELFLARALARCGDDRARSGTAALRAYAHDVRGQFAASAAAALAALTAALTAAPARTRP